jgi:hypothetical protein
MKNVFFADLSGKIHVMQTRLQNDGRAFQDLFRGAHGKVFGFGHGGDLLC